MRLSIGLLHLNSGTWKNIALVVGPHKCLSVRSIRSICQMENSYFGSDDCAFHVTVAFHLRPLDNIAVLVGPHKCLSIRSIRSVCQMENFYFRLEECGFPLDRCILLAFLRKIAP